MPHVILKSDSHPAADPPIFVYTQHGVPAVTVRDALVRARRLWNDPPFLARVIAGDLFAWAGIAHAAGAGLGTSWMGAPNHELDVRVDMEARCVHIGGRSWTYESFAATPTSDLAN